MGKWKCKTANIATITPQGHVAGEQFGHLFQLDLAIEYTPEWYSRYKEPRLEWNEQIVFFRFRSGIWYEYSNNTENMYTKSPNSNTFYGWNRKMNNASYVLDPIKATIPRGTDHERRSDFTLSYLKNHKTELPVSIVDTPMMGKSTGRTERRIIYFDLGIREGGNRETATQILEVQDGKITVMKFITPGLSPGSVQANDRRFDSWRSDYTNRIFA